MLTVVGHRLKIKPIDVVEAANEQVPEYLKNLGLVVSKGDTNAVKREQAGVERGVVVGIGPMAWKSHDLGYGLAGWEPWCSVGDEVSFVKYSGRFMDDPETEEGFMFINDVDIFAINKKAE